jgi:2-methylcitrate dehydratase PrpD
MASGLLSGLNDAQIDAALGIVASLASGLKCNFGSDIKPLQAGTAAGNGVWSVQLAARGVRPADGALFGSSGFCRVFGGRGFAEQAVEAFGRPLGLASPGLNIKRYPCCSSSHTAVDGLLELMDTHDLRADDVQRIEAWIGPDVPAILIYDVPSTPLQAKFSMRYCLAAAAVRRHLGLGSFTADAIEDPETAAMIERTAVHLDATLPAIPTGVTHCTRVRVSTRKGAFTIEVRDPLGSAARPLPATGLLDKFVDCASGMLGRAQAEQAFDGWNAMAPDAAFASWLETLSPPS